MSDDERESGCDTVDGSPASDSSGRTNSPFMESRYIADGNQNNKTHVTTETEISKAPIRTMVVPPMRVQNNNNEPAAQTGKHSHCIATFAAITITTLLQRLYTSGIQKLFDSGHATVPGFLKYTNYYTRLCFIFLINQNKCSNCVIIYCA